MRWETSSDPKRNSLRLLPSGPDRVRENFVRADLPRGVYQGRSSAAKPIAKFIYQIGKLAPFAPAML